MISSHVASDYSEIKLSHINWKQYNLIKKKAMEQEFSWSGLVLSLSIAFFIVIASAFLLSSFYSVIELSPINFTEGIKNQIYYESVINSDFSELYYLNRYS